jgi:hypothetical protein
VQKPKKIPVDGECRGHYVRRKEPSNGVLLVRGAHPNESARSAELPRLQQPCPACGLAHRDSANAALARAELAVQQEVGTMRKLDPHSLHRP